MAQPSNDTVPLLTDPVAWLVITLAIATIEIPLWYRRLYPKDASRKNVSWRDLFYSLIVITLAILVGVLVHSERTEAFKHVLLMLAALETFPPLAGAAREFFSQYGADNGGQD